MDDEIYFAVAIINSVAIICFSILAVVFNAWWIVLFSILFIRSVQRKYFRICDNCGKHSPMADSYNEAIDMAKDSGWIRRYNDDKWEDYCPECKQMFAEDGIDAENISQ